MANFLRSVFAVVLLIGLTGCQPGLSSEPTLPATTLVAAATIETPTQAPPTPTPLPTGTPTPQPTATATLPPLPDLNTRPLIWFSPLPPLPTHPGRPFIGSDDFMDLFRPDAAWGEAAGHVQVFKLYGEWVAYHASDEQLRQVVADVRRRGMALAVEVGPLTDTEDCGTGIEGFAGVTEGVRIANRLKDAGGIVQLVAYDHPYDAGTLDTSENSCHWTPEETAQNAAMFVEAFRSVFPQAAFGDIVTARLDPVEIARWVDAYRAEVGEDLAFVHVDINYGWPDWPQSARMVEDMLREKGIPFGIIYFGVWTDRNDHDWLVHTGERVKAYELSAGGQPDHVIFQSWHDHPDLVLPESQPDTFTWFINQYFTDKSALGVQTTGVGANLAYGKQVRFSRQGPGTEGGLAVDGSPETWWGAQAMAPQWIEVDLGAVSTITAIRLLVSQYPQGHTIHRVLVRGSATSGENQLIHTFDQSTVDMETLSVPLAEPLSGIRYIRIQTISSPSWIAWREIEVIAGE